MESGSLGVQSYYRLGGVGLGFLRAGKVVHAGRGPHRMRLQELDAQYFSNAGGVDETAR